MITSGRKERGPAALLVRIVIAMAIFMMVAALPLFLKGMQAEATPDRQYGELNAVDIDDVTYYFYEYGTSEAVIFNVEILLGVDKKTLVFPETVDYGEDNHRTVVGVIFDSPYEYGFDKLLPDCVEEVVLSDKIQFIGSYAFKNCTGLASVTWKANTGAQLDPEAFNGCRSLTSINISGSGFYSEDGVQYFTNANGECELVRYPAGKNRNGTFTVPEKVKHIHANAFEGCSLTAIYLPKDVEFYHVNQCGPFDAMDAQATIYFYPKYDNNGNLDSNYGNEGYALINGNRSVHNWVSLEKKETSKEPLKKGALITVNGIKYKVKKAAGSTPGKVAVIGLSSKNVTSVNILSKVSYNECTYDVDEISKNAFKGCKKLKTVSIGKNVESIGSSAFEGCTKLSKITLGKNVKSIGSSAFKGCTALKVITIPNNVTKIGKKAFYGDKNLKKITIKSTVLKTVGAAAFSGINAKAVVNPPKKKVNAYRTLFYKKGLPKTAKVK